MSRSVRYAIGAMLILVLLGAGSGFAVARWNKKDAPANWTPDWSAVERGWACVTGELQDVAGLVTPDRSERSRPEPEPDDAAATRAGDDIGSPSSPGDTNASAETGDSASGSPFQSFLDQSRDLLSSLSDEVPRLDEPAPGASGGC